MQAMRIIVAPGAFKHSLTAARAAESIARGLDRSGLGADVHMQPIADGGNGTLDAFLAAGGTRHVLQIDDPLGRKVPAEWGMLPDGRTAVIEMALASGLELLRPDELDPMRASTYGTGQLMQAALAAGATRIIVGMGGSATVDGGTGCVSALGVRLLDADGSEVRRGGGGLTAIHRIDASGLDPRWRDIKVVIASDVENPTLGDEGAAAVFGPQKGASPADVEALERGLRHFFTLVHEQLGVDVRDAIGGGAAGALSAGLMAFTGGRIESGIDLLLAHTGFEALLADAALVVTGEGRMDEQTVYGKGPIGVARLARAHGVPSVALVGGLEVDAAVLREAGLDVALPIVTGPMTLDEAIARAEDLLEAAALRLGYLLQIHT
jgi:glycerate kinase